MPTIPPLRALADNYIWMIQTRETHRWWAVDPAAAAPVLAFLKQHGGSLAGVLVTHYHLDHIEGIPELRNRFPNLHLIAPFDPRLPSVDTVAREGKTLDVGGWNAQVLELPGHTRSHVAYLLEGEHLFCGDVLFSAGCGRIFEGSHADMAASLNKIAALPDATLIYPAHEYTAHNLRFALSVLPEDTALLDAQATTEAILALGKPTLPTTLEQERRINLYLRTLAGDLVQQPGWEGLNAIAAFSRLRTMKDNWRE